MLDMMVMMIMVMAMGVMMMIMINTRMMVMEAMVRTLEHRRMIRASTVIAIIGVVMMIMMMMVMVNNESNTHDHHPSNRPRQHHPVPAIMITPAAVAATALEPSPRHLN